MKNWRLEYSISSSILAGIVAFLLYFIVFKNELRESLVFVLIFSVFMFLVSYFYTSKQILKKKAERDKLMKQLDKEE